MKDSPFNLAERLRPFLPQDSEAPVAAAVSGGPDSMALCHALAHLNLNPVHAVTVDHGLRTESAQEAAKVGAWLKGWPRLSHHILTRVLNEKPAARLQEEARQDRYRLIASYCKTHKIALLFTAHHLDDQAETFLFRLAKGSGLDGLGAMRPVHVSDQGLEVIRPLLDVPKIALIEYCRKNQIPFVEDPSNDDSRFARTRLRRSVTILAQEGLTPKRLAVTATRLARAREALDEIAELAMKQALLEKEPSRIVLNFSALQSQPAEIRLRVLLGAIAQIGGLGGYGPRLERAEALNEKIFSGRPFKRESLAGCLIGVDAKKTRLIIEKEPHQA